MQRKHWAIACVAAAAMAAVVTWQFRRHRAAEAPHEEVKAPLNGHAFQHQHGGGHGGRETPIDEPELRRGPPRVLMADDPIGAAQLSGKVVDGSGAAVAGATVSLAARPPRQATTGADGSFSFDKLLPLPYTVTAYAPSGVAGPVAARAAEAAATPVALTLHGGSQVQLEIVDEQQRPVDGATVELRGIDVRETAAAQGRVALAAVLPGAYRIAAWAEGYGRAFQLVEVGAGTTSVRVELARGVPVSGRVTDEAGKPVAEARVRYETASDAIAGSDLVRDAVITGADGKFAFAAMPIGSYRFIATHAALGTQSSSLTRVESSSAIDNVSVVMPPGCTVRGKVVDAAGAAAAFARVRLGITIPGARLVVPPREVRTNASGEFEISGMARRQLTAVAMDERGASAAQVVDARAGDVAGVVLALDAVGSIEGSVVDAAGKPVVNAQVSAWPTAMDRRSSSSGEGSGSAAPTPAPEVDDHLHGNHTGTGDLDLRKWQLVGFPQATTDDRGAFRVTGLAPGTYRLRATRGTSFGGERGAAADFTVAQVGATAVKLALPAEGGVKGKVAFEDGTAPAQVTVAIGFAQHGFSGSEVEIEGLAPQTYQLVVRGPTFTPRVVDVKVEAGKVSDLGTLVVKPAPR
jgi:protocatechuate 3,4-dioxygenase beta subunit